MEQCKNPWNTPAHTKTYNATYQYANNTGTKSPNKKKQNEKTKTPTQQQ
ncbi:hypothetical protein [Candidatus Bathycorpusculum sp.]|jgi:hypothetical protein|nr:hypothetical protein [Candidatus Termitimicrobium sp.]